MDMSRRDVIELPIKRAAGVVNMKPHQVERDRRTNGRTKLAAVRLAGYRLRSFLREHGREAVDETTFELREDFMRGTRDIIAITSCVDGLEMAAAGIAPGFRVVPGSSYIRLVR